MAFDLDGLEQYWYKFNEEKINGKVTFKLVNDQTIYETYNPETNKMEPIIGKTYFVQDIVGLIFKFDKIGEVNKIKTPSDLPNVFKAENWFSYLFWNWGKADFLTIPSEGPELPVKKIEENPFKKPPEPLPNKIVPSKTTGTKTSGTTTNQTQTSKNTSIPFVGAANKTDNSNNPGFPKPSQSGSTGDYTDKAPESN